jgi:hypothetical protein
VSDLFYVDIRKWPDAPHWHYQVFELGEDAHGRWFCLPRHAVKQRRPEPPRLHIGTTVKLIPRRGSWVASFNAPDHRCDVYVDVAAGPAQVHARSITFVDVDLDVMRDLDGQTRIIDVDEFEEHRISLAYPETLVAAARATADELHAAVSAQREPFGRDGLTWLEHALSRAWPIDPDWLEGMK